MLLSTPTPISRPHNPKKQRPRKNIPRQPAQHAPRPKLQPRPKVPARVEQTTPAPAAARLAGRRSSGRARRDAHRVEQHRRQQREGQVEEEAAVGLEAEDAGGDAKEGGGEGLEIVEGLVVGGEGGLALGCKGGGKGVGGGPLSCVGWTRGRGGRVGGRVRKAFWGLGSGWSGAFGTVEGGWVDDVWVGDGFFLVMRFDASTLRLVGDGHGRDGCGVSPDVFTLASFGGVGR